MKRRLLALGGAVGLLVVTLVAVVAIRTLSLESRQLPANPVDVAVSGGAVDRLAAAVRLRTVTTQDGMEDPAAFEALHALLRDSFPRFYDTLDVRVVDGWTLHAIWRGTDPNLPAVVMLAHQDVVPVADPETWTHPPFSGAVADGYVWGRGTLDDKQNVLGLHEAVEILIAAGHRPTRDVHFVFSHTEEASGPHQGAGVVARDLMDAGVAVQAVFDEGLVIVDGIVPGIPGELALVGISEKGYATLELTATGADGHSSMPPPGGGTAVTVLARALTRLDDVPFEPSLDGPAALLFDWAGPQMSGMERVVFANRWLFGGVVLGKMTASAGTNASLRTTMAPTMLTGSMKENVLAKEASALVNVRIHPRDSVASVVDHVTRAIDDARVTVAAVGDPSEPAPVASLDGHGWQAMRAALSEAFPGTPVAPGLMIGATDSRFFVPLTSNIYRFNPVVAASDDLGRIHGTNERIRVDDYRRAVVFHHQLIVHAGG